MTNYDTPHGASAPFEDSERRVSSELFERRDRPSIKEAVERRINVLTYAVSAVAPQGSRVNGEYRSAYAAPNTAAYWQATPDVPSGQPVDQTPVAMSEQQAALDAARAFTAPAPEQSAPDAAPTHLEWARQQVMAAQQADYDKAA